MPESTPGAQHRVESARARLWRALVRPGRGQIVVAVVLAAVAAAAVTQIRIAGAEDDYSGMRQSDLVQALNGLQAAEARAEQELSELQRTREALRDERSSREAALEQARNDLDVLAVLTGTAPAFGPGLRITVRVPTGHLSLNYLLDGIEELRDAGAEAIEFNDTVRVVAQTALQETREGLVADGVQLQSPYVIDVVGDPDTLRNALSFPGGLIDDVSLDGGTVTIEEVDRIEVTVTREVTQPRFARPVESESAD